MSGKSTNSSKRKKARDIHRPFDPALLKQAAAIARDYRIVLEYQEGEYYGCAVEMPFVMADGKTPDACVRSVREALTGAVAVMLEHGEQPPIASSEETRTEQVNVRLTKMERMRLEAASSQSGFRGLSDYIRNKVLQGA